MTDGYETRNAERDWWGFGSEQGGCAGCGLAWWVVAAVIAVIVFVWGWGWPGWGGWGGWGWRRNYQNCPCATAPAGTRTAPATPDRTTGAPPSSPGGSSGTPSASPAP